jgi:hypothetical protein
MSYNPRKLADFFAENTDDLSALGLMFVRLLAADFSAMSNQPSATLAVVLSLEQQRKIGLNKKLTDLFAEFNATGQPMLTDGFGGSILRNNV